MRILILDLDTLRPDHLGCYGYHRNTSPNIDSVAKEGVVFTNHYCSDAPCQPSRTALVTGQFGIRNGVVGHGGTAADLRIEGRTRFFYDRLTTEGFFSMFKKAGLHTATVTPFAERHGAWYFYAGFKEIFNPGKRGMESAEDVTPFALDWLEKNAERDNWLLHVNYWDPHTPYRAPAEFGNPFENDPLPEWLTPELLEEHRKAVGPHTAREINMYDNREFPAYPRHPGELKDYNDLRRLVDGYDCGIRYMDDHIGMLFDKLREKGVFEETAIIITADHAENIGELAIYSEHATADNVTCNIPLIIRWPGGKKGHVDNGLHYNIDLPPTIAELLGMEAPESWDGRSFARSITEGEDTGRDYLVLSQCAHVCQRSVRFDRWIYIRTYHDGYHLFPDEMLFDVENDPHETTDLAGKHPEVCLKAKAMLQEWHDQMMARMKDESQVDPLWLVLAEGGPAHARGRLAEYCKRLEATDRGWAVEELRRRHPYEFKD